MARSCEWVALAAYVDSGAFTFMTNYGCDYDVASKQAKSSLQR
jgi:hypothetical protein